MAKFIVFEGIDRSGKSTQIKKTSEWLTSLGIKNITVQEPGTTKLGKQLRSILKDENIQCCYKAQKSLFHAARVQLIEEIIKPSLKNDIHVLCDRYFHSTLCYQILQSEKKNLTATEFNKVVSDYINEIKQDIIIPDITFVFYIDKDIYEKRANEHEIDRFESISTYTNKVMKNYEGIITAAKLHPSSPLHCNIGNVIGINSNYSIDVVFSDIKFALKKYL